MLEKLRRGAASLVAKLLIALLILSFAVWGIADMLSRTVTDSIATVGNRTITDTEFRDAYQVQVNAVSRQYGQRLSTEQARLLGIPQQTIQRLMTGAALDEQAAALNLAVPQSTVLDAIKADANFKDDSGKFNKDQFERLLRDAGISEQRYLVERRRETVREQLTDTMVTATVVPDTLVTALHSFRNDTRKLSYAVLEAGKIAKPGAPTADQLKQTYERGKRQYVAPETRKIGVLLLSADAVKKSLEISDADIAGTYAATKSSFGIPEKRRIEQISFKSKADAEAAAKAITGGKSFADVAKAQGATEKDIALGLLSKDELIDSKIADAAFALAKDKVSEPVEGRFTTVLLRVLEIQPGREQPLAEVKDQIRERLAAERVGTAVQKLHDGVDDMKLKGKTPAEIAETLKLRYISVSATTKDAKTADGKPVLDLPDAARIVQTAFATSQGLESEIVELADGGYAWVDVLGVTPEKQKSLDEVKTEVTKAWQDAETAKALRDAASKMVKEINDGGDLASLAKAAGATVKTTEAFNRMTSVPDLSKSAVQQAFALAKDKAAEAAGSDPNARVVFKVAEIIPAPAPTKEQSDAVRAELLRHRQSEVLAEYITGLRDKLGWQINQAAVNRALGVSGQP